METGWCVTVSVNQHTNTPVTRNASGVARGGWPKWEKRLWDRPSRHIVAGNDGAFPPPEADE